MIDDELRALLSVEPAPGFEARTRSRVRVDGSPARWHRTHGVMALAAAIVVAIGIGLVSRTARQPNAPGAESAVSQRSIGLPAAPPRVGTESTVAASPRAAAHARDRTSPIATIVAGTHASGPQVQIDQAESLALQRLFAAPVAGTVVELAPPADDILVIPRIAIEPLTVDIRSEGASQ